MGGGGVKGGAVYLPADSFSHSFDVDFATNNVQSHFRNLLPLSHRQINNLISSL